MPRWHLPHQWEPMEGSQVVSYRQWLLRSRATIESKKKQFSVCRIGNCPMEGRRTGLGGTGRGKVSELSQPFFRVTRPPKWENFRNGVSLHKGLAGLQDFLTHSSNPFLVNYKHVCYYSEVKFLGLRREKTLTSAGHRPKTDVGGTWSKITELCWFWLHYQRSDSQLS